MPGSWQPAAARAAAASAANWMAVREPDVRAQARASWKWARASGNSPWAARGSAGQRGDSVHVGEVPAATDLVRDRAGKFGVGVDDCSVQLVKSSDSTVLQWGGGSVPVSSSAQWLTSALSPGARGTPAARVARHLRRRRACRAQRSRLPLRNHQARQTARFFSGALSDAAYIERAC